MDREGVGIPTRESQEREARRRAGLDSFVGPLVAEVRHVVANPADAPHLTPHLLTTFRNKKNFVDSLLARYKDDHATADALFNIDKGTLAEPDLQNAPSLTTEVEEQMTQRIGEWVETTFTALDVDPVAEQAFAGKPQSKQIYEKISLKKGIYNYRVSPKVSPYLYKIIYDLTENNVTDPLDLLKKEDFILIAKADGQLHQLLVSALTEVAREQGIPFDRITAFKSERLVDDTTSQERQRQNEYQDTALESILSGKRWYPLCEISNPYSTA